MALTEQKFPIWERIEDLDVLSLLAIVLKLCCQCSCMSQSEVVSISWVLQAAHGIDRTEV